MPAHRVFVAAPLALFGLGLSGCCCFSGTTLASRPAPHAVDGVAPQMANAERSHPKTGAPQIRGQSPDNEGGLFEFPTWKELRKNSFFNGMAKVAGYDLNEPLAQKSFKEGEELVKEKKFSAAAAKFKSAARHWPDSPMEEDALFWLGECYFFDDKYPAASDSYADLLEKYDNSRHLDKVVARQFAIGRYWQDLQQAKPKYSVTPNVLDKTRPRFDTSGNALAVYESVRLKDPTGPLADDALMAAANEEFINEDFVDADEYYTLLRSDYPKSEHLTQAYLLGLRAKLNRYSGPQYDSTPLADAQKLIDEILIQFPTELGEERERVIQAGRAVRAQMAEREWQMGEYYHKTKHYRAAGMYYQNILDDFPETKFAELAKERLAEIKDKPPAPPQRFAWIDNVLPKSSRRYK